MGVDVQADWQQRHERWRRFQARGLVAAYPVFYAPAAPLQKSLLLDQVARMRGFGSWIEVLKLAIEQVGTA